MASTPEGKVKTEVKKDLASLDAYWHMPVQQGYGAPCLDFHVCVPIEITPEMVGRRVGLYVGVETKAPGGKPTPRQIATAARIVAAGGSVFILDRDAHDIIAWSKSHAGVVAPTQVLMYMAENGVNHDGNISGLGDAEPRT